MSIELSVTVTGGTIGYQLANNMEEAYYTFEEFFKRTDEGDFQELAEHATSDPENLVTKLRALADAIENESRS